MKFTPGDLYEPRSDRRFGNLVIRRIEIARIGRARANRKAVARDREAREAFDRAVDLNAQIGGRKVRIN